MSLSVQYPWMRVQIRRPVPDKASEEECSTPDESGSVRFFPLRTRQRQPIVHMTLAVQNGLEIWFQVILQFSTLSRSTFLQNTQYMKWVVYFRFINCNYLSLSHSHAHRFGINGLVGQPEPRVYMLNITNGVSILYLWDPHAIDISLCARVEFLLQTKIYCYMCFSDHKRIRF